MALDQVEDSLSATRRRGRQTVPVGVDRCVHDLIEERVYHQPQAPAVCSWDGELTYSLLHSLSSKLAHYLCTLGAGPENIVPFCFEKSLWAVVAALAILKSGSAFVALDPSMPEKRRAGILEDTGARILVTSPSQASLFQGTSRCVVIISPAFIDSLDALGRKLCVEVGPRNAAVVLFTSGSTGQPKGTMCCSYGNALHLDSGCRVLQFASYSFDVSIVDIVDTLIHGACLCIPSEYDRVNNIVEVMNKMRVTWADLTPSFAGTFAAADVPTLQTLVLAGEEVQQGDIESWAGKLRLINCYGPAESSACTACEYSSPVDQAGTIGYPMTHANCWVVDLDAPDRLASIYSPGELVVESPALARGYLNNPEKTQASFIHDPDWLPACDLLSGRRVYMTGDLVRYQPDGSLKFLGRKDNQVKIRGQRVEPSEVEHHLSMYPAIAKCIIAYPKSGCYAKRLVAVIQSRVVSSSMMDDRLRLLSFREVRNTGFDTNEATKYLKRVLPAYMNPTDWVAVESIPLTSSKKLDRKRVEVWLEGLSQKQNPGDVGPSNMSDLRELSPDEPVALKISTIVADVCANGDTQLRKALEGHDFALSTVGINSIHVISISRCIEREFNVKVGVERLTNNDTTVRSVAAEIEHSKENASSATLPATIDVAKEVATFYKELLSTSPEQQRKQNLNVHPIESVFLTGATGFLGTQLLRQLLLQPSIQTIILHVRAKDPEEGFRRIVETAKAADWWSENFTPKLEIWPGDLTKPRLGLASHQWQRLTGLGWTGQKIHTVIHNGGVVRWNADYHTLKPANTLSTNELLHALSASPYSISLVYISGGQRLSFNDEDDEALTRQVTSSNGYAQSKLVSELLVKRFASAQKSYHVSVVKPSYIIGTATEGFANPSDYLWRLVVGAVEIGACNADDANEWLFVSDVGHVARTVVHSVTAPLHASHEASQPRRCHVSRILDGLPLRDFWHLLATDFGYALRPIDGKEWWARMRENVQAKGSSHCLWPLSYMLEEGKGGIGSPLAAGTELPQDTSSETAKAAIRMNVRHLRETGFLPK